MSGSRALGPRWLAFGLVLAAMGLGGCPPPSTGVPPVEAPVLTAEDFTLGPGDTFDVRVFGEAELSGTYRIGADGTIDYPLVGQVKLAGLEPGAAAREIARRLGEKYLKNPQVSILIKEQASKKIIVIGQVAKPGTFSYVPNMTILEAITTAGGFTPMASKGDVRLTRVENGQEQRMVLNVSRISEGKERNVMLRPGDVISVPERLF